MSQKTFNQLMEQGEKKDEEQTGLFKVLKNIQNKKCSCDFLCIEIGTIYGPFDSLRPKNITIMTTKRENVQLIIKPVIVINNTLSNIPSVNPIPITPINNTSVNMTNLFMNEDCDLLTMGGQTQNYNQNVRFKQIADGSNFKYEIKRKFYRKVEYSSEILANDIFKQGLNVIILKREKGFPKIYERTFNTNVDPIESDAMACIIRDAGYDKIIVITGIGKWMGAITPRLVKEIKQIGGPDINRLISVDSDDNQTADHGFILIGRRGLCRYNGIFRVRNYDISKDLKKFFPDLSSDPNDCYFENLNFENEKNKHSEKEFFHLIDMRFTLNLSNDNRFSYRAPIITSVSPTQGPVSGNQIIHIYGYNFGNSILEIKEVIVRGVICKNIEFISSNLITCYTGNSNIMGAGPGNVVIKLLCGLSSPLLTCNMYEYNKKMADITLLTKDIASTNINQNIMHLVRNNVVSPRMIVANAIPSPIIPRHMIRSIHSFRPPTILPIFSFKEKNNKEVNSNTGEEQGLDDVMKNLKDKMEKYNFEDKKINEKSKVDNLVTDNFKNIMTYAEGNGFGKSDDGYRKRRFKN